MRDAGLEIYPELMGHGYYIPETAQYYVSNFIAAGATAILCGSDTIAKGVILECQLHGFNVPNDISVVGFDDVKFAAALTLLLPLSDRSVMIWAAVHILY